MTNEGKRRILMGASHSVIENLGLIYLLGVAREEGWERGVSLVKNHNFAPFFERVREFKPDVVGFNIYTGSHLQLFEAFDKLKKDHPNIRLIIGGPHATYFPGEAINHADNVVMSEGFNGLRRILRNEVGAGVIEFNNSNMEPFPHPDRETFYRDSPEHAKSTIKSIIGETGCPYSCSYCYNSSKREDVRVPKDRLVSLTVIKPESCESHSHEHKNTRLFPNNVRPVEDIIREGREIRERWPETKLLYFQDDVFGMNTTSKGNLAHLAKRWPNEVGIPFHSQMRWEMTRDDEGSRRLDLIKQAGASGMTLAIEAADFTIRKEVLDRKMPEELMFEGMKKLVDRGLTVRTEQITGLPYGVTTQPTRMNLEADLELVELNVKLRAQTGGPTMSWASTLAPYKRTVIGEYTRIPGHYRNDNSDVPDEFFDRSVLRFPRHWIGDHPEVVEFNRQWEAWKKDHNLHVNELNLPESLWLSGSELEDYRDKNAELRNHFNTFCLLPEGHKAAAEYLKDVSKFGYSHLGRVIESHLTRLAEHGDYQAADIAAKITPLRNSDFNLNGSPQDARMKSELYALAPYLAVLPQPEKTARRAIKYALSGIKGASQENLLSARIISTAVRHQLYEGTLYKVEEDYPRELQSRGYPSKV